MSISVADLVALKSRIKADVAKLEEELDRLHDELDATELLERRLRMESVEQPRLDLVESIQVQAPAQSASGFAQAVREAATHFKNEEFTVVNVETVLKGRGVPLPAKNVRARIAGELTNLVKRRMITRTFTGTGNSPHRFRLLASSSEDAEKGEGASARTLAPSVYNSPGGQPTLAA